MPQNFLFQLIWILKYYWKKNPIYNWSLSNYWQSIFNCISSCQTANSIVHLQINFTRIGIWNNLVIIILKNRKTLRNEQYFNFLSVFVCWTFFCASFYRNLSKYWGTMWEKPDYKSYKCKLDVKQVLYNIMCYEYIFFLKELLFMCIV